MRPSARRTDLSQQTDQQLRRHRGASMPWRRVSALMQIAAAAGGALLQTTGSEATVNCTCPGGVAATGVYCPAETWLVNPPEAARTYSSTYNNAAPGTGWAMSMLHRTDKAWLARNEVHFVGSWLQMELERPMVVSHVLTQGRPDHYAQRVLTYTVEHSMDGENFTQVGDVFHGNTDADPVAVVANALPVPVLAQYIRIHPQTWASYVAMRAAIRVPVDNHIVCDTGCSAGYFMLPATDVVDGTGGTTYNTVEENVGGVGGWSGTCTCPDGQVYQVGDNNDHCGSLACINGVSGACSSDLGGAGRRVTCGRLGTCQATTDTNVTMVRDCGCDDCRSCVQGCGVAHNCNAEAQSSGQKHCIMRSAWMVGSGGGGLTTHCTSTEPVVCTSYNCTTFGCAPVSSCQPVPGYVQAPWTPAGIAQAGIGNFAVLDQPEDVSVFSIGDSRYAIIASRGGNAVQLANVTDANNLTALGAAGVLNDSSGKNITLGHVKAVSTFEVRMSTYAIAVANNTVAVFDVSTPGSGLATVSVLSVSENSSILLSGASDVATFAIGECNYAVVTARDDSAVQFLNLTIPAAVDVVPMSAAIVGGVCCIHGQQLPGLGLPTFEALSNPTGVDVFTIGERMYAIVASGGADGVQLIDVTNPSLPLPVDAAVDGSDGFTLLSAAEKVTTIAIDDAMYALVTSGRENGVQMINVTDPGNIVAVGAAQDFVPTGKLPGPIQGGFTGLGGAHSVDAFSRGGFTYAAVTANTEGKVTLMNITDPRSPIVVSTATHEVDGFLQLHGPMGVTTFFSGDREPFALVAGSDNGLQLINMTISVGRKARGTCDDKDGEDPGTATVSDDDCAAFDTGFEYDDSAVSVRCVGAACKMAIAVDRDACCRPIVCTRPRIPIGFAVPVETNLDLSRGAFSVQGACANGYEGSPVFTSCTNSGEYTVSGTCSAIICTSPAVPAGYSVTEVQLDASETFDVRAVCNPGYFGDSPTATVCATAGTPYTLSGCTSCNVTVAAVDSVASCNICAGPDAADCTAAVCSDGYHSYADGTCCEAPVEERTPSGCACVAGFSPASGCAANFLCPAGTMCEISPAAGGCVVEADCVPCLSGTVSISGGSCEQCETGRVANSIHTACESCSSGKAPRSDQSACESCGSTTYSAFGLDCQTCVSPSVVDANRTSCAACPAGTGPNVERTGCTPCTGTTFSTLGVCQDCGSPRVVSVDGTMCAACPAGTGPNVERTGCSRCPGNSAALDGYCIPCVAGKVASTDRKVCDDLSQLSSPVEDLSVVLGVVGTNQTTNILVVTTLVVNRVAPSPGSAEYTRFSQSIVRDLASALGLGWYLIRVTGINPGETDQRRRLQVVDQGNCTVAFTVDSPDTVELLRDLEAQLEDPDSALMNGTLTRALATNRQPTFGFVCRPSMVRAIGDPECVQCTGNKVPNAEQTSCIECQEGTTPSADRVKCICASGSYSSNDLPSIQCYDGNYHARDPVEPSSAGCYKCPPCMDCSDDEIALRPGYRFFVHSAPASQARAVMRCPIPSSCAGDVVQVESNEAFSSDCPAEYSGILCAKCSPGHKLGARKKCERCSGNGSIWDLIWSPLLLVPIMLVIFYFGIQKFLTRKRTKLHTKRDHARCLFDALLQKHGQAGQKKTLSLQAISQELEQDGLNLSEKEQIQVFESLDIDLSESVDKDEFDIWMTYDVSRATTIKVVVKIVVGLGQIVSKQPEAQQVQYPGPQWTSRLMMVFGLDLSFMIPYMMNTVIVPVILLGSVYGAWACNGTDAGIAESTDSATRATNDEVRARAKASMLGDYFFALFLCYPTMTQQFCGHFSCRRLSEYALVLHMDYETECWADNTTWWILAVMSGIGLLVISLGIPIGMWMWMRSVMQDETKNIHEKTKSRPRAYRDFRDKFSYIAGEFKTEAYYADCVDMLRKLVLSSLISLLAPGTVIQSVATLCLSMLFIVLHAVMWPYPYKGANELKLYTDFQVFLVSVVGLVMRMDSTTLAQEQFGKDFYGNALLAVLVGTLVPIFFTILRKSPVERARAALTKRAEETYLQVHPPAPPLPPVPHTIDRGPNKRRSPQPCRC